MARNRTGAEWETIRADFTAGTLVRALGRRYGMNESIIRLRSKAEGWVRDSKAPARIAAAAQTRTLEGTIARRAATSNTAGGETRTPSLAREEVRVSGDPEETREARAAATAAAEERQAEHIAQANLAQLANADVLQELFDDYSTQVRLLVQRLPAEDLVGRENQAEAINILLSTRDTIAGHMSALGTMADKIQNQTRKALGIDNKPTRVKLTAPDSVPGDTRTPSTIDFNQYTTAEAVSILDTIRLLEGKRERRPIPVPPMDGPTARAMADAQAKAPS